MFLYFSSYPSLENELSIAAPFDVPKTKNGNEHILLILNISLRCSLRRIKLRKAICYKKKKRDFYFYMNFVYLLLIKLVQLIELYLELFL
jgi:hypothetical protein